MNRRFNNKELFAVRNHIPIRYVIEKLLAIPTDTAQGLFRFRCPLCAGWNTAIKPETNLSRCFKCARNYNAIDLCMRVRHANFVDSVRFLIEHQSTLSMGEPQATSSSPKNHLEPPREANKKPVAVSDVLAKLMGNGFEEVLKDANRKTVPGISPSTDDIADLEHIVHALSKIVQRLKSTHHNQK
jgi:hypothetical protein